MTARGAFRRTVCAWRRMLLPFAAGLALIAGGCGADESTPVVVRGQVVYSARDGGGPHTFVGMYLRLDGVGWVTGQVVDEHGRFTLRVESVGGVRRYARLHGGTVRFEFRANWDSSAWPDNTKARSAYCSARSAWPLAR